MLRLEPPGYLRFVQADSLARSMAAEKRTLQSHWQTSAWMSHSSPSFPRMKSGKRRLTACAGLAWILPKFNAAAIESVFIS